MTIEEQVSNLIIAKHVELIAKGFSVEQADAAIKRARRWAQNIANKVDESVRPQTFLSLFEASLRESESWLNSIRQSGQRWASGLETSGATVGPISRQAYDSWAR